MEDIIESLENEIRELTDRLENYENELPPPHLKSKFGHFFGIFGTFYVVMMIFASILDANSDSSKYKVLFIFLSLILGVPISLFIRWFQIRRYANKWIKSIRSQIKEKEFELMQQINRKLAKKLRNS
ncbi:MAG: hypothetical protein JXC36_06335 [Candidatus Atribacteria bacterium]|nr:hypothetical protein [Candidatus Atribacteria bacterium]